MDRKKWSLTVIILFWILIVSLCAVVYIVDPLFHFHKPYKWVSYTLGKNGNYEYKNDGISKNFDYDAIITGTSFTEHFSTKETDELFGVKSVRLTFLGEGFKRINDNLETALSTHPDTKIVIRGVDPIWFVTGLDYLGKDSYPEYLYDDIGYNDIKYMLNLSMWSRGVIPEIERTIKGYQPEVFDSFDPDEKGGRDKVYEFYKRPALENRKADPDETKETIDALKQNIERNIISVTKKYPNTKFYLFFPPYGSFYWDEYKRLGDEIILRRIEYEKIVIEMLLECDNVEFYSFNDCFDITTDLDNYVDDLHYTPRINSYMLNCFRSGEHRLTKDNYEDYIQKITDFYMNYDYDAVFGDFRTETVELE